MNPSPSQTNPPAKKSPWATVARLAAAVLMSVFLVPSASAQFIYVANTGENTVSKIDINLEVEVARYATWFPPGAWPWPAPSRITRDSLGYVYVLNRFFGSHLPVLVKIAPSGGTLTTTSSGPTNVLTMTDNGATNDEIDAGDTKDARTLWGKSIGTAGTDEDKLGRALCMDRSGFLWVGLFHAQKYYKVDPANGSVIGVAIGTPNHTPYGCQVDTQGRLWSASYGTTLAEIDTVAHTLTKIHDHGSPNYYGKNYSISLFNGCGSQPTKVYLSASGSNKTYIAFDPQTSTFSNPPTTGNPAVPLFGSIAVGVDLNGNIVSGEHGGRVIKTTPAGAVVWDTSSTTVNSTVTTTDLHGIIIDDNNNVWAVDKPGNQVVKYSGVDGHRMAIVPVGKTPYTYGNPPAPSCPCAKIREQKITCEKQKDGTATYSWTFTFTNNSPFSMPATGIDISSTQVTGLTPTQFAFNPPVPPNGQATVTGTFEVKNPVPGSLVCLDIRLNFGEGTGWCCPTEHVCFVLPECPTCAKLQGVFKCSHGRPYLELSVTNLGPTAAQGAQIFSNTPGVTISPQTTNLAFPQNTPVMVPLTITGATPGQSISLSVMLHGPIDPKTGVYSWCCTATVKVTYPDWICWFWPDGWIFDDVNANGIRDAGEGGLPEWTVTLTDAKGKTHTTKSDASGKYQFEEIEPGKYRLSVQPPKGWRSTSLKRGVNSLSVEEAPKGPADFGFVKTR